MQRYEATDARHGVQGRSSDRAAARTASLLAVALGGLVIWVVGFSHVEALHNAAHDTRHSNAFPCH